MLKPILETMQQNSECTSPTNRRYDDKTKAFAFMTAMRCGN